MTNHKPPLDIPSLILENSLNFGELSDLAASSQQFSNLDKIVSNLGRSNMFRDIEVKCEKVLVDIGLNIFLQLSATEAAHFAEKEYARYRKESEIQEQKAAQNMANELARNAN